MGISLIPHDRHTLNPIHQIYSPAHKIHSTKIRASARPLDAPVGLYRTMPKVPYQQAMNAEVPMRPKLTA